VADIPTDGIHTTEWEREKEREEFAQAARLYRPLAAMIATRFTRAQFDDDDAKALLPAHTSVCFLGEFLLRQISLLRFFVSGLFLVSVFINFASIFSKKMVFYSFCL